MNISNTILAASFIWMVIQPNHQVFAAVFQAPAARGSDAESPFEIERTVLTRGYDGQTCWVHARAGVIPATDKSEPTVVVTTQKLELTGSDVFRALHSCYSSDLGQHWSDLKLQPDFRRWIIEPGVEETICDFTPAWHAATGKLLGTGQSVRYRDNKVMKVRPRYTGSSVYDPATQTWSAPKKLEMPDEEKFANCGAGSVQRCDLPNGQILLPVYFKRPEDKQFSATVCRCDFDGQKLTYVEHGTELTIPVERGFAEPSLTRFNDRYFLTLRNDQHGYVSTSEDGLNFGQTMKWKFDDGQELGNYNTQQHWVTHASGLFLVYTRRGANNDHVFRHRAPLFIARVDPETLQVLRDTEQILVPERGARLGNFGVVQVSPDETWVIVTEWMQATGDRGRVIPVDNKYGADNSIHVVKLKWLRED